MRAVTTSTRGITVDSTVTILVVTARTSYSVYFTVRVLLLAE